MPMNRVFASMFVNLSFVVGKNISKSQVFAIGDGANDLGMLTNAGLGVGYHAHQIVRDQVDNQVFFNDLETILYYLGIEQKEFDLN